MAWRMPVRRWGRAASSSANSAVLYPPWFRASARCVPAAGSAWLRGGSPPHSLYLSGRPDDFVIRNVWPGVFFARESSTVTVNLFDGRRADDELHAIVSVHGRLQAKYVLCRGALDGAQQRHVLLCTNECGADDHLALAATVENDYGAGVEARFAGWRTLGGGVMRFAPVDDGGQRLLVEAVGASGSFGPPPQRLLAALLGRICDLAPQALILSSVNE